MTLIQRRNNVVEADWLFCHFHVALVAYSSRMSHRGRPHLIKKMTLEIKMLVADYLIMLRVIIVILGFLSSAAFRSLSEQTRHVNPVLI